MLPPVGFKVQVVLMHGGGVNPLTGVEGTVLLLCIDRRGLVLREGLLAGDLGGERLGGVCCEV